MVWWWIGNVVLLVVVLPVVIFLLNRVLAALERIERGESAEQVAAAAATPAGGFTLGLRAARMALSRVFRRFFLPYQPAS